jgi:outer membrane protein TolC
MDVAKLGGYTVQAGLTFSFPIERNAANGQYAAARESVRKARLSADAITIQVAAGVTRATYAISLAEKRVGVLARATDLAALDLEAERARFQVGRSSNFDVLRRQDELARAQLQQARAKADYLKGEALLDSLTAEILPRFGVELR